MNLSSTTSKTTRTTMTTRMDLGLGWTLDARPDLWLDLARSSRFRLDFSNPRRCVWIFGWIWIPGGIWRGRRCAWFPAGSGFSTRYGKVVGVRGFRPPREPAGSLFFGKPAKSFFPLPVNSDVKYIKEALRL